MDALRGSRAFLASETVMPVAGLCPACSRGRMAAGLDGLSASRGSHLDFALDAHALASGLPRSSVRLTGPSPPSPCLSERHLPLILD